MSADQAFNEFVNSSGTAGYGNDLLRAAQSGDPNAVAAYARKYGTTISLSSDPATRAAQLQGIANGQFSSNGGEYQYVTRGERNDESSTGYDVKFVHVTLKDGANQGGESLISQAWNSEAVRHISS